MQSSNHQIINSTINDKINNKINEMYKLPYGLFTTNYNVPKNTPIIALPDIHADIDALIISLRDCAKVIKIKNIAMLLDMNLRMSIAGEIIDIHYAIKHAAKIYNSIINGNTYASALEKCLSENSYTKSDPTNIEIIRANNNDILLESLLNLNLNTDENIFQADLGFEWCGDNTHVVIIGDILDGIRSHTFKFENTKNYTHQYYQLEIKILKFLNLLDIYAVNKMGRVIKLLGNHELENMCHFCNNKEENLHFRKKHSFSNPNTKIENKSYYKNLSRLEFFNFNKPGYELLRERGTGIILKINNNIFVHASLIENDKMKYYDYSFINNLINNKEIKSKNYNDKIIEYFKILSEKDSGRSILWERADGEFSRFNVLKNNETEQNHTKINDAKDAYCNSLGSRLVKFCEGISEHSSYCNTQNLRLIVGHTTQHESSIPTKKSTYYSIEHKTYNNKITFSQLEKSDETTETFNNQKMYMGHPKKDYNNNNIIFGVTAECIDFKHQIFRIDVGQSRAFDNTKYIPKIIDNIQHDKYTNLYLLSRSPQVLQIINDDLKIIRSKLENTRKHQPRIWLEDAYESKKINNSYVGKYYKYLKKNIDKKN
jgi:hypothetical protein